MKRYLLLLLVPGFACADLPLIKEYGTATTVDVCLPDYATPTDFETSATFEAGDVTVMKDEGAPANIGTLPTDEGTCYSLPLTATEMQAARVTVNLIDQTGTKVWMDTAVYIETYGNASSQHPDLGQDVPTADENRDAVMQYVIEDSITVEEAMCYMLAVMSGEASFTASPDTGVFQDPSGTDTRVTITYGTDSGDRSTVTVSATNCGSN